MLRTVPVMDVKVYDENFPITNLLCIARSNCNIIEYAKAHSRVCFCMMTGRPDSTERPFDLTAFAPVYCLDNSTGSKQRSLKGVLRDICISVIEPGEGLYFVEILSGMHSEDLFIACPSRLYMDELVPAFC